MYSSHALNDFDSNHFFGRKSEVTLIRRLLSFAVFFLFILQLLALLFSFHWHQKVRYSQVFRSKSEKTCSKRLFKVGPFPVFLSAGLLSSSEPLTISEFSSFLFLVHWFLPTNFFAFFFMGAALLYIIYYLLC